MALKKSELYSSLWQICDERRGGMDASQYKKGKEKGKGWTCDLIPKTLTVARTFATVQEAIDPRI